MVIRAFERSVVHVSGVIYLALHWQWQCELVSDVARAAKRMAEAIQHMREAERARRAMGRGLAGI